MKLNEKNNLTGDICFANNLIKESQVVMKRILKAKSTPVDIQDKIRRIHDALDIDVEEMDRILKLV